MALSQSTEDYLKAIYTLEEQSEKKGISTKDIAAAMNVSAASVTNMMKRLSEMGLVKHESYYGVQLTGTGEKVALEIIRHHRLLELYLKEIMGYSWDQVHDEAEKLEHHISEQFEDKIAELLNDPIYDPHGDPIPSKDGMMPEEMAIKPLSEAVKGEEYIIGRVKDQSPELLRYFEEIGIIPGVKISIKKREPLKGPITLKIENREQVIGFDVAQNIFLVDKDAK
jgi:DtxR family transcriptional regulator, Mn-dependent transcriptional regulator